MKSEKKKGCFILARTLGSLRRRLGLSEFGANLKQSLTRISSDCMVSDSSLAKVGLARVSFDGLRLGREGGRGSSKRYGEWLEREFAGVNDVCFGG